MTKLWGNHTIKFGGDYRHNSDYLLQTQDQGGPRGFFTFNGEPDRRRRASPRRRTTSATRWRRSCSIGRATAGRDLAVIDKPGTVHSSVFTFIHDKWQVSPKMTARPRPAARVLHAVRRHQTQGGLSNYDPVTNQLQVSGYGDIPDNLGVEVELAQLQPADSACPTASTTARWCAPATASSTIPFGDNTYAYNFPVKQNNQFNAANAFIPPPGISMAGGLPGAGRGATSRRTA